MEEINQIGGHNLCEWETIGVKALVERQPAADVVEVVRCEDCKHWRHETECRIEHYECNVFCGAYGRGYPTNADDFCSYGERKTDGGNREKV